MSAKEYTKEQAMLIDCWHQFCITVTSDGTEWMNDGALSTLESVSDYLLEIGYLVKHPTKYIYTVAP